MRKIAKEISAAILLKRPKSIGNTTFDGSTVFLHGNPILHISEYGAVEIDLDTCRAWPTVTTRSRVNEVLSGLGMGQIGLTQCKFQLMVCNAGYDLRTTESMGSRLFVGGLLNYAKVKGGYNP